MGGAGVADGGAEVVDDLDPAEGLGHAAGRPGVLAVDGDLGDGVGLEGGRLQRRLPGLAAEVRVDGLAEAVLPGPGVSVTGRLATARVNSSVTDAPPRYSAMTVALADERRRGPVATRDLLGAGRDGRSGGRR